MNTGSVELLPIDIRTDRRVALLGLLIREELIEPADNDIAPGRWFDFAVKVLIPLQFTVLIVWWLYQAATSGEAWWNPFGVFTLGTCLFQWAVVLLIFYLANDRMAAATLGDESA